MSRKPQKPVTSVIAAMSPDTITIVVAIIGTGIALGLLIVPSLHECTAISPGFIAASPTFASAWRGSEGCSRVHPPRALRAGNGHGMSASTFDTHAAVTALRDAGLDEAPAVAIVNAVRDKVVAQVMLR